jgi:hypothetical protein
VGTFSKSYHPERHYMRGPGPKWHEKHKAALHQAASAQPKDALVSTEPELGAWARIAARRLKARHNVGFARWIVPLAAAALLGFVVVATLA